MKLYHVAAALTLLASPAAASTVVIDGTICTNTCFGYGVQDITPDYLARFGPAFGNLMGQAFELVINNSTSYSLTINNHTVSWQAGDPHISISFDNPLLTSFVPGAFQWTDQEVNAYGLAVAETLYGCPVDPPVPGVPEASTWLMLLLGFGGLAAAFRCKRRLTTMVMT
jgi:hypothetical protein